MLFCANSHDWEAALKIISSTYRLNEFKNKDDEEDGTYFLQFLHPKF